MNQKTSITLALVLAVLIGGWFVLGGNASAAPLTALTPLEKSPLAASATLSPEQPIAGTPAKLTFSFTENGKPVTNLMVHHGHQVHVVLIGADLMTIGHVHPADFPDLNAGTSPGTYSVQYTFPTAGRYIVAVDVMNPDGALSQQFIVNVAGTPSMGSVVKDSALTKCFKGYTQEAVDTYTKPYLVSESEVPCPQGYQITLTPATKSLVAGQDTLLRFHVEKNGKPVTDLTPYLSAPIHLAIVPQSLDFVLHRHGDVDEGMKSGSMPAAMKMDSGSSASMSGMKMDSNDAASMSGMKMDEHDVPPYFGPDLISEPIVFPKAGTYRIFAQVKHGTEIITADFMVEVGAAQAAAQGPTKTFDLTVMNRKLKGDSTLTVNQGDTVVINITDMDENEELHLHGYDKAVEFKKGEKATITFTANASGRFPFELEKSKTDLGALEVQPQ